MDIFIDVKHDDTFQVGEKVRFDLTRSFVPKPNVTSTAIEIIEVDPLNDGTWIEIHSSTVGLLSPREWYFDWIYSDQNSVTSGTTQEVNFRFTASDLTVVTKTISFDLLTAAQDNLFSTDNDLIYHENDILNYLPDGRSTWNYLHRRSQQRILSYLFEKGYKNTNGSPFTKDQIIEKYDFKEWSTFKTLKLIFGTALNSTNDVFQQKAQFYENLEGKSMLRDLRIDLNSDSVQSELETIGTNGVLLVRR